MTYLNAHVSYEKIYNFEGWEVLLWIKNKPRRIALCTHEADAANITVALAFAAQKGEI